MMDVLKTLAKNWLFAWNNYSNNDVEKLKSLTDSDGCEVGEEGTPHLQSYVQLKSRKRVMSL